MKSISREVKYLRLSGAVKRKRATEWCIRFLKLDIDKMSASEFYGIVEEYECIVAYPEDLGFYHFPMHCITGDSISEEDLSKLPDPEDEERAVRETFKDYQQKAGVIMADFKNMKEEPGLWLKLDTTMEFTVRVGKKGTYSVTDKENHDFEYSYARQIARVLKGRRFDDTIKMCPVCDNYFPNLTGHRKRCCSHKCSMILISRNKFVIDPILAKKQRNISVYFSGLKRKDLTDKQKRSILRSYMKKREYKPEEIPRYIQEFIG